MSLARFVSRSLLALGLSLAGLASAAEAPHWGYHGEIGPAHWGDLSPEWALCRDGQRQTPIDLRLGSAWPTDVPALTFGYGTNALRVFNNGHTVQADVLGPTRTLRIGTTPYRLVQFHWHTPSEHTAEGAHYPIEMHLVHQSASGELAVVGVFVVIGRRHVELDKIFSRLPSEGSPDLRLTGFNLSRLLPATDDNSGSYFSYSGSLTTPGCKEDVRWSVLRTPIEMSLAQAQRFVALFSGAEFPEGNARPVQPLGQRSLYLVFPR